MCLLNLQYFWNISHFLRSYGLNFVCDSYLKIVFNHLQYEKKRICDFCCLCSQSAKPSERSRQTDDDSHFFELPLSAQNGSTSSKRIWEYDVPEMSIPGMDDRQMPEMPNLESVLANSLQSVRKQCLFCSSRTHWPLSHTGPTWYLRK